MIPKYLAAVKLSVALPPGAWKDLFLSKHLKTRLSLQMTYDTCHELSRVTYVHPVLWDLHNLDNLLSTVAAAGATGVLALLRELKTHCTTVSNTHLHRDTPIGKLNSHQRLWRVFHMTIWRRGPQLADHIIWDIVHYLCTITSYTLIASWYCFSSLVPRHCNNEAIKV